MTAINEILQQPVTQAIGRALLQFVWQGALIGALSAALLAALRRSAADVRYVVSTIALSLMLTMPVVTAVQSLAVISRPATTSAVQIDRRSETEVAVAPAALDPVRQYAEVAAGLPLAQANTGTVESWLPILVGTWLAGVMVLTLRLFSGWLWVQRMRSHGAVPAGESIEGAARRLTRRLHISRPVRFLESALVDVPTVIGWLKPVVLLPASALAGLSPRQLEAILAHELAHVRRHDYLVNLLQAVVETLLFYHPAVWWLSHRIRIERENCCDDLAVSLCGDPVTYAAALAELEGLRGSRQLVLAANGGSLLQRVKRVLGAPTHAGRAPGWLAASVAILVIVGMSAGALGPDVATADSTAIEAAQSTPADARQLPPPPPPPAPPAPPSAPGAVVADPDVTSSIRAVARQAREVSRTLMEQVRQLHELAREAAHIASGATVASTASSEAARALEQAARAVAEVESARPGEIAVIEAHLRAAAARAVEAEQADPAHVAAVEVASTRAAIAEAEADVVRAVEAAQASSAESARAAVVEVASTRAVIAEAEAAVGRAVEAAQTVSAAAGTPGSVARRSDRDGQKSGNYTWSDNGQKLEVNYRGDVEFTDDDTDVRSLTPGGWLRIKDSQRFGTDNTIEFRADGSGNIERRFWVGNSERPFEPEGRKWLAQMLPRFVRQSGIGAAGRVARIFKAKGTAGVLAEISLIEGGWAKRIYFSELLKTPSLAARDVQQALAQAGQQIDSDFELASLLISADRLVTDDATRKAYFDAARTIGSDFEMRRVFSSALKNGPVSPALLAGVLDASTAIDSDFEAASLLVQVAKLQPIDGTTRAAFFKALSTVGSAFEHRRVLTAVLQRTDLSPDVRVAALESSASIGSDFERASVLLQFVKENPVEGAARDPFFRAVSTISSAFERGRVLQAVARRSDASDATILSVIRAAQTMNGNFERAQVLLAVAGAHQLTREGRDAYIDASEKLGDHEQGRVLSALVRNERKIPSP